MPGAVKGSRQHRMTVVRHRPWQLAAIYLSCALLLSVALVMAYHTGYQRGADNLSELDLAHSQGLSDVQRATRQTAELQAALSVAERNLQVDEQVKAQAQASIAALRSEIALLQRDVALYRQVMALEAAPPALSLQSWQVHATELPNQFRYRLTLAYTGADGGVLSGELRIIVSGLAVTEGAQEPDRKTGPTVEVTEPVNLRYLQVLEGNLLIPSGFTADHVKLDFSAGSPSSISFGESMPWQPEGEI
jgi:hypothetical protein